MVNSLHEKRVCSARRMTRLGGSPYCEGRVKLLAGLTFLHINTLGQGETYRACASIVGSDNVVNFFVYKLSRERLSEKVPVTIPIGIVGWFELTVLHRNLKEWHERPWTYVCKCLRKAANVG